MSKVDCIGFWDDCSKECGIGTQKFRIITKNEGNGTKCATNDGDQQYCKKKDCDVNCEGNWQFCTKPCGGGKTIFKVTKPKQGNGTSCEYNDGDTASCNTHLCPDVNVNCEGKWQDCTQSCGGGKQIYKVTKHKKGNGTSCPYNDGDTQACNTHSCNVNVHCEGKWGDCTQSCGGGKQMFTVTKPKEGNGWPCMANDGDTQPCNTHNCNVNCQGNWKPCSASCGNGTQQYKITTIKQGNGSNCKSSDNSSQSCKIINCITPVTPANCVLDDNWGPCVNQVQRKEIKIHPIGTGTCVDSEHSTRKRNC